VVPLEVTVLVRSKVLVLKLLDALIVLVHNKVLDLPVTKRQLLLTLLKLLPLMRPMHLPNTQPNK